jgi:hypothetical protein
MIGMYLANLFKGKQINSVKITYPDYLSVLEKSKLMQATQIASLKNTKMVPESFAGRF